MTKREYEPEWFDFIDEYEDNETVYAYKPSDTSSDSDSADRMGLGLPEPIRYAPCFGRDFTPSPFQVGRGLRCMILALLEVSLAHSACCNGMIVCWKNEVSKKRL